METTMIGLALLGVMYRVLLAAIFHAITQQDWLAKPYPTLGSGCLAMSLMVHEPSNGMATATVVGFFVYDALALVSKLVGDQTKNKKKTA
jgi:hypothetical protein